MFHATTSLDGFLAGPGDSMEWLWMYAGPNPVAEEAIRRAGAVVAGRRSYDLGRRTGARVYGGAWEGPIFVVTHRAAEGAAEDTTVTFVADGVASAIAQARAAAGGRDVVLVGASIGRQALDAGLVDEILVHLAPVLLGGGVRMFEGLEQAPVELERLLVEASPLTTDLRFRVRR